MLLLEALPQERAILAFYLVEGELAGDLDVLHVVATIRVEVELAQILLDALSLEPLLGFRLELLHPLTELGCRRLFGDLQIRFGELVLDIRREEPESAHHPWGWRDD